MISPVSTPQAAQEILNQSQPAPTQTVKQSNAFPQDTVTLSSKGQAANAVDVDHDGDSH